MAERDYSGLLPTKPPDDIVTWLHSKGQLKKNLLIYKMSGYYDCEPLEDRRTWIPAVELLCSACHRRTFAGKVNGPCCAGYAAAPYGFRHPETDEALISGGTCLCPECGEEVTIAHVSNIPNGKVVEYAYPMTVDRVGDKLALIGWCVRKLITKTGETTYLQDGYEAYVVEETGVVRINGYRCFMGNASFHEWEQRKKCDDIWQACDLFYPWDARLLEGSTAENSKLDVLIKKCGKAGTFPVTYLRVWQKMPQIENLVVQGASLLVTDMLDNERVSEYYSQRHRFRGIPKLPCVNRKEKAPDKMLGMTREEYRRCIKGKWSTELLKFWQGEKRMGRSLSDEQIKLAKTVGLSECVWFQEKGIDWIKGARYVSKQKAKDKRADMMTYRDYHRIAQEVGEDMTLPAIQFPPNLMRAHDRVERVRQQQKILKFKQQKQKFAEQFTKTFEKLSWLSWETPEILIRPIRDEIELKLEGKILNHCVGSYTETHIKGEHPILVVRRANNPETPWYTLQLNVKNLTVTQNRGKHNCTRTPEVEAFEVAWLSHIREVGSKRDKDGKPKPPRKKEIPATGQP